MKITKELTLMEAVNVVNATLSIHNYDAQQRAANPKEWPGLSKHLVFALVRNKTVLKPTYEAVAEMEKPSEEMKKYEDRRVELGEAHAKKDAAGEALTANGNFVIEDRKAFDQAIDQLKLEFKDAIDAQETSKKEVAEKLKEKEKFELSMVRMDQLPKTLPMDIAERLLPITVDDDEDAVKKA